MAVEADGTAATAERWHDVGTSDDLDNGHEVNIGSERAGVKFSQRLEFSSAIPLPDTKATFWNYLCITDITGYIEQFSITLHL